MRAKRIMLILFLAVMIIIIARASTNVANASSSVVFNINTNQNTKFYLVQGTSGSQLPQITYSGSYQLNVNWSYCSASVDNSGISYGGIGTSIQASCNKASSNTVSVSATVSFTGIYGGGNYTLPPFDWININFYSANDTQVASAVVTPSQQVQIIQDNVISISLVSVSTNNINYIVSPPNPSVNENVQFLPVASTATVDVQLAYPPSVSTQLTLQYGSSSTQFYISSNSVITQVNIANLPLTGATSFSVVSNNGITIYSTSITPSTTNNYGGASIVAGYPIINYNTNSATVTGVVNVISLPAGSLNIIMTFKNGTGGSKYTNSVTVSSPGTAYINVSLSGNKITNISGQYIITYYNDGESAGATINFSSNYSMKIGDVIYLAFIIIFSFMMASGGIMIIIGLFWRNFNIVYSGAMFMIGGVLIFLIPTLIGDIIYLLDMAGFQDPALIGPSLTIQNLGNAIDSSIGYIMLATRIVANQILLTVYTVIAILVVAITGSVILSIFTFGGGSVIGDLVQQLFMVIILGLFVYYALYALSAIFPIIMIVTVLILVFIAVIQIIFGIVTGNIAPAFNTVISLASVILLILLAPVILFTLNNLRLETSFSLGPITIPSFESLVIGIIEAILLAIIIYIAFQRMISALSGLAGGVGGVEI